MTRCMEQRHPHDLNEQARPYLPWTTAAPTNVPAGGSSAAPAEAPPPAAASASIPAGRRSYLDVADDGRLLWTAPAVCQGSVWVWSGSKRKTRLWEVANQPVRDAGWHLARGSANSNQLQ